MINRLFSLRSSPQSPSPVPAKRSKFDILQSPPSADKDRKPDWLQSLSKSANKVCVSPVCVASVKPDLPLSPKVRKGDIKAVVLLNHHIIIYERPC